MYHRVVARAIRGNVEDKVYNVTVNLATLSTTGTPVSLTGGILQGVNASSHVADGIRVGIIDLAWIVSLPTSLATPNGNIRVVLFQWLPDDTVDPPTTAGLFSSIDPGMVAMSMYNYDTRHKYRVLYDQVLSLCNTGMSTDFIRSLGIRPAVNHTDYTAGTAKGTNQIYVFTVTDGTVGSCFVTYAVDVHYTDA